MEIQITYSLYVDSLKKQLKRHGLKFSKFEVKLIQKLTLANLNLKFHEIINLKKAEEIQLHIHFKLMDHLKLFNDRELLDIDYEIEFI